MADCWQGVCDTYQQAITASDVESKNDPENEPYRSKYRARELLREARALLGAEEESGERQDEDDGAQDKDKQRILAARRAVIEFRLGVNHTETEEMSAGEEHLVKVTRILERYRMSHDCVSAYLQAQNNLGILWADRGEIIIAQTYLESAESLYRQYMKKIGKPPIDPDEHFTAEEKKLTEQERSKRFERVYTHTMYYLAQVYKHLKQDEKAAQYCHTTLQRQLEYDGYNPMEWAINAATLSQYYLGKQCYMEARHCLAAANVIFSKAGQTPSPEAAKEDEAEQERLDQLRQKKAEIARCWVKYVINVLQDARKKLEDSIGELDVDLQDELKAERRQEEDEKEKGRKKAVLFGSSDIYDSILAVEEKVECSLPLDFKEAREVFLVGQNYINEAKEYFQLDGHVTDHIDVIQDNSALFKILAFFEEDYERRCKMHKRRVDMLEPLTKELNPQYYLLVCRQLQFELADTYYEMMDLKVAIGNKLDEMDSHTIKKINSLAQSAIKYYEMFLDSLRSPDKKFPEKLEEDVLRPALVAKFHIARLYGKLISSDPKKQLENMQKSLNEYTFVVEYCANHEEAVKSVETELELTKEMVTLLPARMERLRAQLCSFT
ncbi:PREDICTED: KIF1-binding protein isoform X1 [Nanorana parkeri]|uniref:KIF1-binding protein isoform X1 n=1 Tax=Nanorana parkeri TaxID=125878 RepID=UPI000854D3A5|nr:PREDICTED: KIF1-binding protein isoform X1 [Nanorana parkeri]